VISEERHFSSSEIEQGARRTLGILGLQESSLSAAVAAVESQAKDTMLSMDGIVQRITDRANRAYRLGTPTTSSWRIS